LLSVFFAMAFVVVGGAVTGQTWSVGWRAAWQALALVLIVAVAPLAALGLRDSKGTPSAPAAATDTSGLSLAEALRTPAFWTFGGAIALFALVAAGFGLFNEAVLAERGFDARTYHAFLAVTTLFALIGQFVCGWACQRVPMTRLLAVAMFLYAAGLGTLPLLSTLSQLWIFAAIFGVAAGMITVVFLAVWSHLYGRAHLGRIQGAAQMLSVFASAIGPLLFAKCHERFASYTPILYSLAPLVLVFGFAAWWTKMQPFTEDLSRRAPSSP
jgi:cyanate permease